MPYETQCSTKLGSWPVYLALQQSFIQFWNIKTCHWQNASQSFLLFSSLLKACWEYTLYVESWHLVTEWRHWLGQQRNNGALNHEIPLNRIWGHWRTVTTNTFISSFCQNKHCVICKDTLALNNKIRAISSYSAQLKSTSMPPSTHTALMKAHVMLTKGKCFDTFCLLQRQMKCIMLQSVHYPGYGATPISISLLYTKQRLQSPLIHPTVLWHLLQTSFSIKFTTPVIDTWSDTEIETDVLSHCFTYHCWALNTREICKSELNEPFYQHDQTQQISCICLNTTFWGNAEGFKCLQTINEFLNKRN